MTKPNIILITADHMRHDALACNGNKFIQTPNLDRLAKSGITFSNSFTPNPICVPARASITTGNYPHKCTGFKTNSGKIKDGQPLIAQHFADAGYRTYAIGKLHYVPYSPPGKPRLLHGFQHAEITEEGRILRQFDPHGLQGGLEDYHDYLYEIGWGGYERAHGVGNNDVHPAPSPLPEEHYVDSWVAMRSIHYIKKHLEVEGKSPFFMWISFPKPHSPYDPPEPYHRLYDARKIPPPAGNVEMLENKSPVLKLMRANKAWELFPPQGVQLARAYYFGMVTFQDKMIGKILDFLEEEALRENTIIIYTGDHGDLLGDFGCFYKGNFLNGSVKVPFIISAPGLIPKGQIRSDCFAKLAMTLLVGLQDVLPTLSGLTKTPLNQNVDGIDLSEVLANDRACREFYVAQCGHSPWQSYMLCDGKWKYIYSEANGFEELYDLKTDPNELCNLAFESKMKSAVSHWRSLLISWCKENGDTGMLDGNNLRKSNVNVEEATFQYQSMGWRWY
ncbi:MAG: sulfatase [Candidatus Poribacteria bacterium]